MRSIGAADSHLMRTVLIMVFALLATPAFAQFPPPGVYLCTLADGAKLGTWSLLVAGDYQFDAADGTSGKGQVASAGTDVEALTGPLADIHAKGTFATNDRGEAEFGFDSDRGRIGCVLPPL